MKRHSNKQHTKRNEVSERWRASRGPPLPIGVRPPIHPSIHPSGDMGLGRGGRTGGRRAASYYCSHPIAPFIAFPACLLDCLPACRRLELDGLWLWSRRGRLLRLPSCLSARSVPLFFQRPSRLRQTYDLYELYLCISVSRVAERERELGGS